MICFVLSYSLGVEMMPGSAAFYVWVDQNESK